MWVGIHHPTTWAHCVNGVHDGIVIAYVWCEIEGFVVVASANDRAWGQHVNVIVSSELHRCIKSMKIQIRKRMKVDSQVGFGGADESRKFSFILALNVLQSHDSSSLFVYGCTELCFALDDDIRHAHLAAESRKEDNKLDRINVMCNDDKRSLHCFDEGNTVIQSIFDSGVFWSSILQGLSYGTECVTEITNLGLNLLLVCSGLHNVFKTSHLLLLCLWVVFV